MERVECTSCHSYKRVPAGNGCTNQWCHAYVHIKECTCDQETKEVCAVCLKRVEERRKSEEEYAQLQARLADCWCAEWSDDKKKPEIYSRCSSDGSKTTVIYTYIQCDACRTTSKNTVTSDDPKKNFTLEDVIKDWNTLIAKEKAS